MTTPIERGLWPFPVVPYRVPGIAAQRWNLNRYRMIHCSACVCSEISSLRVRMLRGSLVRYLPGWRPRVPAR